MGARSGFAKAIFGGTCLASLVISTDVLYGYTGSTIQIDRKNTPQLVERSIDQIESGRALTGEARPAAVVVKEPTAPETPDVGVLTSERPSSTYSIEPVASVSGKIRSRLWLPASIYSPDRAISELRARSVGNFRAVGFPDIRTHKMKKRFPWDPPGPWARMVAWRTAPDSNPDSVAEVSEPIARVHCMGLSPQDVAERADQYRDLIYGYAKKYDVDALLIKAIITQESCFNNQALSRVGAQGLMQLMPDTASMLKVADPHDPVQNVRAGVKYLARLQNQFASKELALAAYNAGPGNVRRYNGIPPFAETQLYVSKVQAYHRRYQAAHRLQYLTADAIEQASNTLQSP